MKVFRYYKVSIGIHGEEITGYFEEKAGRLIPCEPFSHDNAFDVWSVTDDVFQNRITISTFGDPKAKRLIPVKFDPANRLFRLYNFLSGAKDGYLPCALDRMHNFIYVDELELCVAADALSDDEKMNLFAEALLGSWKSLTPARLGNLAALAGVETDCPTGELRKIFRRWYGQTPRFATRLIGFQFQAGRFLRDVNGVEKSKISKGDACRLVREPHNHADPNAVMIIHKTGLKMGYLRRTIAEHIAPVMDKGAVFNARVSGFLSDEFAHDNRVCLTVERVG